MFDGEGGRIELAANALVYPFEHRVRVVTGV